MKTLDLIFKIIGIIASTLGIIYGFLLMVYGITNLILPSIVFGSAVVLIYFIIFNLLIN